MKNKQLNKGAKIIFVDFDGVLNSEKWFRNYDVYISSPLEPEKMELLKQIVSATGAKIVLSTSWRNAWQENGVQIHKTGKYIDETFKSYGMSILSKTPDMVFFERNKEIRAWLASRADLKIEAFCILDDVEDAFENDGYIKKHLVLTDQDYGLSACDVQRAIKMLNGE